MRTTGSPAELERRRLLAAQRVSEGYTPEEVADFLGVDPSSVRRWCAAFRRDGRAGLTARPVSGRPSKLTPAQEKVVRRWLVGSPIEYGFSTELWTSRRLAQLLREELGVAFHPHYLSAWLRQRGFAPQKPRRQARERDEAAIARWLSQDWPRIKKRPAGARRRSC
jgi:transposase